MIVFSQILMLQYAEQIRYAFLLQQHNNSFKS